VHPLPAVQEGVSGGGAEIVSPADFAD
jgi:hypothetical protein